MVQPLIDFRCRPNTKEYMVALTAPLAKEVMSKLGSNPPEPRTLDEWVDYLKYNGVEKAVFTGRESESTGKYDVNNEYVASVCKKYSDTIIGFAGIDPSRGDKTLKSIDYCAHELGLRGVSIDPYGSRIQPNDASLYKAYERCQELNLPVVITCGPLPFKGPRLSHGDVRCIDDIAVDFPDMTIIIDHTGWPWVTEAIAIALRNDNVYIDTSLYMGMPGASLLAEAANSVIPKKLLFASCFPIVSIEAALKQLSGLPFDKPSLRRVTHDNALELLKRCSIL